MVSIGRLPWGAGSVRCRRRGGIGRSPPSRFHPSPACRRRNRVKPMKNKGKPKSKGGNGSKGRGKPKWQSKAKVPKEIVPKEGICFHCKEPGHWKRNCKLYLDEFKKKKSSETTASGIYVIDINLSISTSWVLDTGCGSHICTNVKGLKRSRKLKKGDVDLRVGNEARVAAIAVGTYELVLPNGFLLVLNNCLYIPTLSRNIISVSVLDDEGFSFLIKNKKCSIK
ncbi:hypothetical protein MANES_01G000217v8 [Manihot esculenta]|uniref:Uncharacterized protein n=1 Tax=Manihot esculenta TaxID=3983 RepID=A0ACB7I941_MANES|nr:hypothetical protein MANES_01G000217v8 [Manihot esculenta]